MPGKKQEKPKNHTDAKYILLDMVLPLLLGFIPFSSVTYCTTGRRKRRMQLPFSASSSKYFLPKVSYKELFDATGGFSQASLISSGIFGTLYRGILEAEQTIVAVKEINLEQHGALRSYTTEWTECNALRNISHSNLVKVLTACSSVDFQGHTFKTIVLQYMPTGSWRLGCIQTTGKG